MTDSTDGDAAPELVGSVLSGQPGAEEAPSAQASPPEPQQPGCSQTGAYGTAEEEGPKPDPSTPQLLDAITGIHRAIESAVEGLLSRFEDKLAHDRHKDSLIDRLHAELQAYKSDLVGQATRPLKMGLIRLHDDLGKTVDHYVTYRDGLSPERLVSVLRGFQTQVEIVLEEGGVTVYQEEGEQFQPRRQKALRTVSATEPDKVGRVVERLRPGFEAAGAVLEKERVAVYVQASIPGPRAEDGGGTP